MKKFTIEFNWAIIYTLASLLWNAMEKAVGLHDKYIDRQMTVVWLFGLIAIPIYFLALRDKRKNFYNGNASWTQLFLSGVIVSVFVALFSPLAQYITLHIISPDFVNNSVNYFVTRHKWAPEKAAIFFSFRSLLIQGISNIISVGVIISSLVALFLRTESPPEPTPKVLSKLTRGGAERSDAKSKPKKK